MKEIALDQLCPNELGGKKESQLVLDLQIEMYASKYGMQFYIKQDAYGQVTMIQHAHDLLIKSDWSFDDQFILIRNLDEFFQTFESNLSDHVGYQYDTHNMPKYLYFVTI